MELFHSPGSANSAVAAGPHLVAVRSTNWEAPQIAAQEASEEKGQGTPTEEAYSQDENQKEEAAPC